MFAHAPAADRNLLFGILALQMDFITRDQLVAGMHAWVLDKKKPLGQILCEQQSLTADTQALLEALVQKHLDMHGNDAHKSLAALSSAGSARKDLEQVPDPDIQASLHHIARPRGEVLRTPRVHGDDPFATGAASTATSTGLRFRILRPHAEGGLGTVFVAHDEELHREVALKEIKDRYADKPESRSRFLLEAEITGGLEHPGIVPVYGLGQYADGRPFYAMRFIRGDSLKDAIENYHARPEAAGLELRKLLGRFVDVCNAMQYAHDRGVLHRDLKPGNIMLGKYGETLVVDWGLAKPQRNGEPSVLGRRMASADADICEAPLQPKSASGSAETQAGSAIGTPAYMSPEQAAGRLDLLGPASDVYSLGATLYALLTGRDPFEKLDVPETLKKVQHGDFPRPRRLKADIAPALEAICLKAMSLHASDRYPSPKMLADDVEQWLADAPVSAWPEPWTVKTRRWVGRHRSLVTGAAAALFVGIVGLMVLSIVLQANNEALADANQKERDARELAVVREKEAGIERDKARNETKRAEDEKKAAEIATSFAKSETKRAEDEKNRAEQEKKLAQENETKSEWRLYASQIASAQREWETSNIPLAYHFLNSCRKDFRGWEHDYLYTLVEGRTLRGHTNGVTCVAISPDGKTLISASVDRTLKVWDVASGQETQTLKGHSDIVMSVAFSPDGKEFVSASDDKTLKLWNAATYQETLTFRRHTSLVRSVAFSPNGKQIVSGSMDNVKVWDTSSGQETLSLKGDTSRVACLAFSPDGKNIVGGRVDGTLKLWDPADGRETRMWKGHTNVVNSVAFSPDGKTIVSGSSDKTLKIWDVATGQELRTLKGHMSFVGGVSFSPDGKKIVSGSLDKLMKVWDPATGQEIMNLKGHVGHVSNAVFSPDGKTIISGSLDKTLKFWDADRGQETLTLKGHKNPLNGVAFSPDSKTIVSASSDKTLKMWDAASGREIRILKGHTGNVNCVAFSPDGKKIVSGSDDKTLKLWDALSGQEILTLKGHARFVASVAFSPDGTKFVSGSWDLTLKVWDTESGEEILNLKGHTLPISSVAFSSDGTKIVSGSMTLKVWDAAKGHEILTLKGHTVPVNSVAFSPDGTKIVSGSNDKTLKIWDAVSGREKLTLTGHTGTVMCVAFSPDGKTIVSGSLDTTLKVWDAATGQETLTLKGHSVPIPTGAFGPQQSALVSSVAFSPDGKKIVSGSYDKTLKVWDASLSMR